MNLFSGSGVYNEAIERGLDGDEAEQTYNGMIQKYNVPRFIARRIALNEVDIPEDRLRLIGRLFGPIYNTDPEDKP